MIDQRLQDILNEQENNYLLPFYRQHGSHRDSIPAQIERFASTGCRALCVESCPHPDFYGDDWWADMNIILAKCQKSQVKVWILDDKHFSTGYANSEYGLAKPADSLAHQEPRMQRKAMRKVFGAYEWGEEAPMRKWRMDFLLVRDVLHFIPHTFSPDYLNHHCPPHFDADTVIHLPARGHFVRLHLIEDTAYRDNMVDGTISVKLILQQSEILLFGNCDDLPAILDSSHLLLLHSIYTVEIANAVHLDVFHPLTVTNTLKNITAPDCLPDFSGKMRYTFPLTVADAEIPLEARLDPGQVRQTSRLFVNSKDCGFRVCAPYVFFVGQYLHAGENRMVAEIANTLVGQWRGQFSFFLSLFPSGLLDPIAVLP